MQGGKAEGWVRNVNGEGWVRGGGCSGRDYSPRGGLGRSSYGEALSSDTAAAAAAVSPVLVCKHTEAQCDRGRSQSASQQQRRRDSFALLLLQVHLGQ